MRRWSTERCMEGGTSLVRTTLRLWRIESREAIHEKRMGKGMIPFSRRICRVASGRARPQIFQRCHFSFPLNSPSDQKVAAAIDYEELFRRGPGSPGCDCGGHWFCAFSFGGNGG